MQLLTECWDRDAQRRPPITEVHLHPPRHLPAALGATSCSAPPQPRLSPPFAASPCCLPPYPNHLPPRPAPCRSAQSRRRREPRLAPTLLRCAGDYARWSWRSGA
jgi:hypothetical protein